MADHDSLTNDPIARAFGDLFANAPVIRVADHDRFVIMSDMHIGNGGKGDDFLKNARLCADVLERYYLDRGFNLLLNGDIEELHRFTLGEVEEAWPRVFDIFAAFAERDALYKTIGNHDAVLPLYREYRFRKQLHDALRLECDGDTLFVFHGHQASMFQRRFNMLTGMLLRLIAKPLRIKSYSVSADRRKQFRVERRIFRLSSRHRIASVIGHTHRPLFESLSKADTLRFDIEALCRAYAVAPADDQPPLGERIAVAKAQLDHEYESGYQPGHRLSVYNSKLLVPCLFNSGCTIGKRGITAIEVIDGSIALVHWTDAERGARHFRMEADIPPELLPGTEDYRIVLHEDTLSYIFTRIRLLSD